MKFFKSGLKFYIVIVLIYSCSSVKELDDFSSSSKFELIATEKYKGKYKKEFNTSKTYVLCKSVSRGFPFPLSFFVFDIINQKIIFEESLLGGSIKWLNNSQIQIISIPGNIKGNALNEQQYKYFYDVLKKKRITKILDK